MRLLKEKKGSRQPIQHGGVIAAGCGLLLCCLLLLLSACSLFPTPSQGAGASDFATETPTTAPTPTLTPTPAFKPTPITLQVSNCPTLSINWDSLLGTKTNVNKVQQVTCGNLEQNGALTALVVVRYYTPDAKMDCYVYDNLTGTPVKRFSALGLVQGKASISPANTLLIAENASNDPIGPNVFKEYQWNASSATFQQILFPGIYPDVTHYQAEQSEALASSTDTTVAGQNAWRLNGGEVLHRLAYELFHWTNVTSQNIAFNNAKATYVVQVTNQGTGGGGFTATLFRLDGNVNNIFEVSQLVPLDTGTSITSPASGTQVTNPVTVNGTTNASGSILGHVVLYDDNFTIVGDSGPISSPASSGYVDFSQSVHYQLNGSGVQEGVVAFYSTDQNNISFDAQVELLKVFFS
ncbi:MAG TPA: hypothetical protein VKV40_11050 [Ktedonobacteraceae bacterium]|nr:hypothetical protein [Ktedonobacteraceae bacterium]